MAEPGAQRSRGVFKGLWLSDAEWKRVQRRMKMVEATTFAQYARTALTESKITVRRVAFDPAPLRAELSRIGNNINQIARHVNTDDATSMEEMRAARQLLGQIQHVIESASEARVE